MQSKLTQKMMLNLEKWRVDHDMSQSEFANKIKLSPSTYHKLVNGSIEKVSVDTLYEIYNVTGLLCHQLMEVYTDDYLKLSKICRGMNDAEMNFMLYTAQNLILMREGKL